MLQTPDLDPGGMETATMKTRYFHFPKALVLAAATLSAALPAWAQDPATFTLVLEKDVFSPAELKVPAQTPFVLKVINNEIVAVEIEAKDLKIEKVAAAGTEIVAKVKPLAPGRYLLVNEYKEDSVQTYIVVE